MKSRLRIHNVRLGGATNSSSAHSVVINPQPFPDAVPEYSPGCFGWDNFVLAEEASKLRYLATQVYEALKEAGLDYATARIVINHLLGVDVPDECAYVDHESVLPIVCERGTAVPDREFLGHWRAFLGRPDVVVYGGNDNNGLPPGSPLAGRGSACFAVARRDGDIWTLFNRSTKARVSFSFDDPLREMRPPVASAPDLVDVCLTLHCGRNCPWCYQDARADAAPDGGAPLPVGALADLGVFEVVLGGGEPTLHPGVASMIDSLWQWGFSVGLTTRDVGWLERAPKELLRKLGAIGVSVETRAEADRAGALAESRGLYGRLALHVIPELTWNKRKELSAASRYWGLRLVLLGYKAVGRAADYKAEMHAWAVTEWLKVVDDLPGVAVDTTFAHRYEAALRERKVSPVLYEVADGERGAYLDLPRRLWGPCSYERDKALPWPPATQREEVLGDADWDRQFARWMGETWRAWNAPKERADAERR